MMRGTFMGGYRAFKWGALSIGMILLTTACTTKSSMIKGGGSGVSQEQEARQPKPIPTITRLDVVESPGGMSIVVEGEIPLKVTSFRLTDPPRFIVDIAGLSFGTMGGSTIQVRKGGIAEIRPIETDLPNKVARLEILLTEPLQTTVNKDGNRLVIEVSGAATPNPVVAGSPSVAEEQTMPPPPSETVAPPAVAPEPVRSSAAVPQVSDMTPTAESPKKMTGGTATLESDQPGVPGQESSIPSKKEMGPSDRPPAKNPSFRKASSGDLPKGPKYAGKSISLDFQDAEVTNVLRLLADVSGKNMVLGENVRGKVTIKLLNVPWDQALDVVLRMKGLGVVYENNVIRIDTHADIAKQQDDEARAKESLVKSEDLTTRVFAINYARAKDLLEPLKKIQSSRGEMMLDDRTNTLIAKDIASKIEELNKVIRILDQATPQVLIEARIVQADTSFARDLGVQWGGDFSSIGGSNVFGVRGGNFGAALSPTTGFAVDLPASGVAGTLGGAGLTFGRLTSSPFNLDLRISAGESRGLTKIISSPKIATLDNREAKIEQGQSIPYQTSSAQLGTRIEFVDATLTLTVTPKVTPDGHVNMKIKITKNRPGTPAPGAPPPIDKKEAATEVLVKDGETTVIGGIFEVTDEDNVAGVPWFYKLPVVGYLFKKTSKSDRKSELLIFITPRIITPAA